ncbi:MAG: hypothetical protein KC656_15725 [Myxococcales bacterium]|nr:hypothetical protein [Myxococcales bacterium]
MTRFFALALGLSACSNPSQTYLDEARDLWAASGPTDYSYHVVYGCFCPEMAADVVVTAGTADVTQVGQEDVDSRWTSGIPAVYDAIQATIDDHPDSLSVSYENGVPTSISVDPIANAIDDEWGVTISEFTAL